LIVMQF
jgi:hypothetical protein